MSVVLGIDGGGTKTTGVVANAKGEIFAQATVGATNPNSVTKANVKKELSTLLEKLRAIDDIAYSMIKHIFAGIAGASHEKTQADLTNVLASLTDLHIPVTINHDAITALYSGTLGKAGIVQIAGTGAVTYGINDAGVEERSGGWGHLFSDHGSGYAIGRDALEQIFLAYDGFPIKTVLVESILDHFKVKEVPDIIRLVYHQQGEKSIIASLSKLVTEAAAEGDVVAQGIVIKNGEHLGKSIALLIEKLFNEQSLTEKLIPIVLVGGLFNRLDLLKESIYTGLDKYQRNAELIIPNLPPVGGSVIAALQQEQIEVPRDFVKTFTKT